MASGQLNNLLRDLGKLVATGMGQGQPDQALLERFVAHHDEAAFAALVERHGPMVLGVCRRVLWREQDAEDAFQAAFLVLARNAGSIRKRASVGSWLHGVAHRVAGRLRRDHGRRREQPLQEAPRADTTAEVTWREVRAVLDEELDRLPERFRAPLVLCYLEGKTRDEAAADLGCKASTLKGRLERGRELLRARLSRRGLTLSAALLGALLSQGAGSAVLAPALLGVAVRAVVRLVAGGAAAEVAPARVLALTRGALPAGQGRLAALVLVVLGLVLAGGIVIARQTPKESATRPAPAPQAGAEEEAQAERRKLEGTWLLLRTESDGRPVAEEDDTTGKCVIRGDRIDLRPRIQQRDDEKAPALVPFDRERVTGTFALTLAGGARRLTITGDWLGPRGRKKATFRALYRLDGDTLHILLPPAGAEPPEDFRTALDSGQQLFVFRRELADQRKLVGTWMLEKTEGDGKDITERDIGGFCNIFEDRLSFCPRVRVRQTDKGVSQEQLEDLSGTYRIDASRRPARLVVKGSWGKVDLTFGGTVHIPYELDGETLRLWLFPADIGPPAKPGTGPTPRVLTLRRDRRWDPPAGKAAGAPVRPAPAQAPKAKAVPKGEAVRPPPGWREKAVFPVAPPNWAPGSRLYTSFRVSPDGGLLGHANGVTDLATGVDLTYRPGWGAGPWIQFVGFTPGGRPLGLRIRVGPATRSAAGCTLIDCTTNRERAPLDAPWGGGGRAALRPDGRLLALSHGGAVTLWDATTGRPVGALAGRLEVDIKWLAFSPDGKALLAAGNEPWGYTAAQRHAYLKLWEVATLRERASRKEALVLQEPGPDNGWGMVMPFSPDGKRVALPCRNFHGGLPATVLRFWDTATLKDLRALKPGRQDELHNFAFTADGTGVALICGPSAAATGRRFTPAPLTVLDLASGREQARVAPPSCGFAAVAYSPDGRVMVTQDNLGTIRVWERQPGR